MFHVKNHKEAARRLNLIVSEAFSYIKNYEQASEYEVRELILMRIKNEGMKVCDDNVIVSFGKNTQYVHYFPSQYCRRIKKGDLIMIDAWARLDTLGAPYADITRMGYFGEKVPDEYLFCYDLLVKAQDKVLALLRSMLRNKELPKGREVDSVAREFLQKELSELVEKEFAINDYFPHTLGHSLGMKSPHGQALGFGAKNDKPIKKDMGWTIEPGLYFPGKFGLRSEIDIFIDNDYNLEVTSKRHKVIEIIK